MTIDSPIRFRSLQQDDLSVLEEKFPQPTPISHQKRLEKQAAGECSYVCAEQDGAIIAIQIIRWQGPKWDEDRKLSTLPEIGSLYTLPEFRGQGIGSALVKYSEKLISDRGYSGVGAIIKDNNEISIAMHIKDGYKKIAEATRSKQAPDLRRSYYIKRFVK